MKIREEYNQILHRIRNVCINFDSTQSENLMKIIKMTKLKDKFSCLDYWSRFTPNAKKPYSILKTEASNEGQGMHWVGVFQDDKRIRDVYL